VDTPFDIPDSWEWVRFKDLVDYSMGKTPPRKETEYWSNGTLPWVSIADLVADGTVTATKECVNSFAAENTFKGKISKAGTLLMSFKLTVGKVSILGIDAFHNEAIISIYPFVDPDKITTMFLFATLPLLSQSGDTKSAIKGNTLNSDSLDALLIPLPPIMEQKRIFDKLHELTTPLFDYGAAEQKVTELNVNFPERLKKSILQEAVQGKLVSQDPSDEPAEALLERIRVEKQRLIKEGKIKKNKHESVIFRRDNSHYEKLDGVERCIDEELPFEIPENWRWCRLGTIAAVLGGKRIPAGRKLTEYNTGHVYIRVSDMTDGGVSTDRLMYVPEDIYPSISRYIINKADVFITVAGTIGRVGKIPDELDGANLTENADRLVLAGVNQDWLIKVLQSGMIQEQIAEATTKVGQPKLAIARIERFLIPLPPLAEQHHIVQRIEELLPLVKGL
jgi:type I restriction enzyme S subunit